MDLDRRDVARGLPMKGALVLVGANALAMLAAPDARCDETVTRAAESPRRPWGVGFQLGWLGVPRGHVGVPMGGEGGYYLTPELVGRRELARPFAINVGIGIPHAGMGLSGWAAFEVAAPVAANARATLAFDLYVDPGLELGYAGPDYYARHSGDFVGYEYAKGGPLAFALRSPAGARLRWADARLDSYLESVPIVALTPSAEPLFQIVVGTRLRF